MFSTQANELLSNRAFTLKMLLLMIAGCNAAWFHGRDSLSRLEIGVDVDYAFKLKLPDESYRGIDGVSALVDLVERRLSELQAAGSAA